MSNVARRLLPSTLFGLVRKVGTALISPLLFSYRTGHFRSSLTGKAVDRLGRPLPWYTYPAIAFLAAKTYSGRHILEWGAGGSTLWWAQRADRVTAFEADPQWHAAVKASCPANTDLYLVSESLEDVEQYLRGSKFDLIIIDGLDRLRCAEKSVNLISADGGIILDNSDGFWGPREGEYPILALLRANGFQRVDFYGPAPGLIAPHCTSLFFKSTCFLICGPDHPRRLSEF